MALMKSVKDLKFDKRIVEWALNNGQLSQEDLDKNLKELPDLASNVLYVDLEGDSSDNDSH